MGKSTSDKSLKLETYITRRRLNPNKEDNEKKKRKDSIRKVSTILQKCETSRTVEEKRLLESFSDIARTISKRKARTQLYKDRIVEKEDAIEIIEKKSERLAQIISRAKHLVCYTGAGISTSAKIPDYRGSQGIWTLLQQGKEIGQHDLSLADPTYTHMALYELHRRKMLRFVVSQNCDGLHLRAGLPKVSLSEVHGNMYIEVCKNCKPNVEYWRLFDTTELTARFYHKTNRRCHLCNKPLNDTIVHFGERGNLKWPLNWAGACMHSEKADVILCLGSSLKVLKKYSWLWQMDRPLKKRAKICIVNLQWTPKDKLSTLKINGKCDQVMEMVMKYLNINVPEYTRERDPIFSHASLLCTEELHTVSQPMLKKALKNEKNENDACDDNNEDHEVDSSTTSEEESRSANEFMDSENSCSPNKTQPNAVNGSDTPRKSLTPINKPLPSPLKLSPVKTVPYVKTSLNSKHLLLAEAEKSSASEDDESECEDNNTSDLKRNADISAAKDSSVQVASVSSSKPEIDEQLGHAVCTNEARNCVEVSRRHENMSQKSVYPYVSSENAVSITKLSNENNGPQLKTVSDQNASPRNSIPVEKGGLQSSTQNGCENAHFRNKTNYSINLETQRSQLNNQSNKMTNRTESNITNICDIVKTESAESMAAQKSTKLVHECPEQQLVRKIEINASNSANSIISKIVEDNLPALNCDSLKRTPCVVTGLIASQHHQLSKPLATTVTNALTNALRMLQTRNNPFKSHCSAINGLNQRQLYEINPIDLAQLANTEEYYRNFYEYCKAVEQKLPYWYDVGYAYSGLHSIIQPPPPEIDLWSSRIVPIFNMNKNEAECEFCFENYAEFKCQFYRNFNPEFAIKNYRNEKLVVCECCDFTDDDEVDDNTENLDESKYDTNVTDLKKRAKIDMQILKEPSKIQAGWYGKGYRKNFRKRRR